MPAIHYVESPTGLVHLAPTKRHTRCGREIDLTRWVDRGQTPPGATLTTIRRVADTANLCEKCFKS